MSIPYQGLIRSVAVSSLVLWAVVSATGADTAPAPAKRAIQVSYQPFQQGSDYEVPEQAVASIDAATGFSAKLLPAPSDLNWRTPPDGVKPENWLSLVKVKNGRQCDFLAFAFADDQGTVAYATRRPSRFRQVQYWFAVPPGPDQIPMNAIRETATDFIYESETARAVSRPRLQVIVKTWEEKKEESPDLFAQGGGANISGAQTPADLAGLEALAFAAAYGAGWQPTAGQADATVTIEVRQEMAIYFAVRATLKAKAGGQSMTRTAVPREELYPHLVRILRRFALPETCRDFGFLGSASASLLGWLDDGLVILDGPVIKVLDADTGKARWSFKDAQRTAARYAIRSGPEGKPALYRYDWRVSRIDATSGVNRAVAPVGVSKATLFDVSADGMVAVISNSTLRMYRGEDLLWTFPGDGAPFIPVFSQDRLLLAGSTGTVFCLDPSAKKVVWQTAVGAPLAAPLTVEGDLVLAAGRDTLFALRRFDGKPAWQHKTGDVLVSPPATGDAGIVVASKQNRIWVLDPANGAVKVNVTWPTWLTSVAVVNPGSGRLAVCTDIRNRISVLRSADLKPVHEYALKTAIRPDVLYIGNAPLRWVDEPIQSTDEGLDQVMSSMAERSPALVGCDQSGFAYIIPVPKP